jgi:hypothetical protein
MCKDMHKKAKHLRLAYFFIKSSVIHTIITLLFDDCQLLAMHNIDIFVINSSTNVCMFISLHICMFGVSLVPLISFFLEGCNFMYCDFSVQGTFWICNPCKNKGFSWSMKWDMNEIWVWSISGVMWTEKTEAVRENPLSSTNPTSIALGLNLGLCF